VLVAGAAWADRDGFFGAITAAWIQAVGSIAAIAAAIWIDRGEARRAREAVLRAEQEAISSRLKAIRNAANVCLNCSDRLESALGDRMVIHRARAGVEAHLDRARRLVRNYIEPGCEARLADLLLCADEQISTVLSAFESRMTVELVRDLRQAHTDIEGARDEYDQGVW
jgi:hypothetical protein